MDGFNVKLFLWEFSWIFFYIVIGSCLYFGKWGIGVCFVIIVIFCEGKYLFVVRGRYGELFEFCVG